MIQSLFILNGAGEQFFQKHWRGIVHRGAPDLFWAEVSRARHPRDVPPVISTSRYHIVHVQRSGLYLVATVQREMPPLLVIEFLHRSCDILDDYLKGLSEESIRNHFVTVFQLFDELLDNGFPHTTEPNVLKELIPPPGLVSRVLQAVTGQSGQSGVLPAGQLSNVPWRRSGVKYSSNEIYFDILEEVDAIIDANGLVVSAEVNAEIQCNSKLSGMPDLTLSFSNAGILDDCAFHPCVRYARYQRDKVLSFVPPDGAFKLMSYRVASNPVIPVVCKPTIKLPSQGGGSGNIDVTLAAKPNLGRQVEDAKVTLTLPRRTSSTSLSANCGNVVYDQVTRTCIWDIGKMPKDKTPRLTGGVTLQDVSGSAGGAGGDAQELSAQVDIAVGFKVPMFVASGIRVADLAITGEKYKPYKGVRSVTKAGRFHVRT